MRKANKQLTETVRKLTGQQEVWEYICPQCYPEKITGFLEHKIRVKPRIDIIQK